MVLKTLPERLATIRRMAALPGSGVRPDQALATAQAFEKLIDETDGGRDGYWPVVKRPHQASWLSELQISSALAKTK